MAFAWRRWNILSSSSFIRSGRRCSCVSGHMEKCGAFINWLQLDFLPGTCPFDIFPSLLKLPLWLQPWHTLADRLTKREATLHHLFLKNLKSDIALGSAPDCFGNTLLKVRWKQLIWVKHWRSPASTRQSRWRWGSHEYPFDVDRSWFWYHEQRVTNIFQSHGAPSNGCQYGTSWSVYSFNWQETVRLTHRCIELNDIVGTDRLPTWNDQDRLPYLRALIKELHRWAPIGSLGAYPSLSPPALCWMNNRCTSRNDRRYHISRNGHT